MKVLANETKRILAVLLSVAMIFAYVPNNVMAYADEPSDNNAPAIEGSETGDVSAPAEDAKTEEPAQEEDKTGEKEPLDYTDDVQFVFINPGADEDDPGTDTHVSILNGESRDKAVPFYGSNADVFTSATTAVKTWDSSQDYVFTVEADTGYVFDAAKYVNQKDKVVRIWATKDGRDNTNSNTSAVPQQITGMTGNYAIRDAQYSVEFVDSTHAKVTIFSDWMVQFRKDYVAAGVGSGSKWANPAIMIEAYATADTMPATATIDGTAKGTAAKAANAVEGAQPDTYVVQLNSNYNSPSVTEEMRTATYGYDMNPIVMTAAGGAISGRPVTGVKIRYNVGTTLTTLASPTDNAAMVWNPDALTLTVDDDVVKAGYVSVSESNNHWMEIEFISEPIEFTQTNENASDNRELKFKLDGGANSAVATGLVTATTAGEVGKLEKGLLVMYEPEANSGRVLNDITYTVATTPDPTTKTIPTADVAGVNNKYGASVKGKSVYIPKEEITKSIAITGNFGETLTFTPDDDKFVVRVNGTDYKEAQADPSTHLVTLYPYTDKDFTFGVYTPDGKTELSVQYKQGSETADAVRNADDSPVRRNGTEGLFTIPAAKMNQKTELIITSKDEADIYHYNVKAAVYDGSADAPYPVKSSTGAVLGDVKIVETKYGNVINGTSASRGTKQQPLYFTVIPTSPTDNVVKAVYWKEQTDPDNSELQEAQLQSTGTGLYMIPAQSADIEIQVVIKKLWVVKAPANDKVVVTINGDTTKTYSKGSTVARVEDGVRFTYTLKTTDEAAVKLTKTGYAAAASTVTNATAIADPTTWDGINLVDLTGETAGESTATYQVAATEVTGPIALYAQTLETRADGDGYYVDFATTAPTSAPAGNVAWEATWDSETGTWTYKASAQDDANVDRIKEDDMYVLRVNQNTAATLTPVIRKTDGIVVATANGTAVAASTTIDVDKTEYKYGGSSSSDLISIDKDTTDKYKAVITAKAQGDDSMAYTVTQKTTMTGIATDKYDENLVAVSGKLKIRVTPHFLLDMETPQTWIDSSANVMATLTVINGATLSDTTIKATAIGWGKAGTKLDWSTSDGVVTVTPHGTNTTATISVTGAQASPYKLFAYITDTDNTKYNSDEVSLQPIDVKNYVLVPDVKVAGGGRYFGKAAADKNTKANTNAISLGANDLSEAKLAVYPYEGAVTDGITYEDVDTEDDLELALMLPESDGTKYAREIEGDVTYTATATRHGSSAISDDLQITDNNDGTFTVKALKTSEPVDVTVTATYGGRTFNSVVTFAPCTDTEWIHVDFDDLNDKAQTGVDNKPKVQKFSAEFLKDKVLWNSSTDGENAYPPQNAGGATGSTAYKTTVIDGYQFKIINGSEFTLPRESDLDQSVYTDKSRMLIGWTVTAANGDIIDDDDHSLGVFHRPGETIAIKNTAEITPVWDYRYALRASGVTDSGDLTEETGFFIDNGKTQKIDVYSYNEKTEAIDTVREERTNDTLQLATYEYPTLTRSAEADTISLTKGMKLGATVYEYINAQDGLGDTVFNRIYPMTETGKGQIQWHFFNETITGTDNKVVLTGGDNTNTFNIPTSEEIKNGGNADNVTRDTVVKQILATANQTVLNKDQLAKGILQGANAGKAYLYATYTDTNNNVYYLSDQPLLVEVQESDAGVNANIEKIPQQNNLKNGIEVGEQVDVAAGSITVRVGTTTLDATSTANSTGTFKWNVEPAGALKITPSAENSLKGELQPTIEGLAVPEASADGTRKAGEAKVWLTYTAANGVSADSDPVTIKVLPASFSLDLTDKDGKALTGDKRFIDAAVGDSATAGTFYMTVKDAAGAAVTTGTLAFTSDDNDVVKTLTNTTQGSVWANKVDGSTLLEPITLGEANITATYTSAAGKKYNIKVPFRSYYSVSFGGASTAFKATDSNLPDTLDAKLATAANLNITNAAGTVISDATSHVYVKKIYKSDLNYKDGKGYTLELGDYKAAYTGDDKESVHFIGWTTTPGAVQTDRVIKTLKIAAADDEQMYAIFGDTAAESLTVNRTKIVLDNTGSKGDANEYVPDSAKLIISVGPKTSGDVIKIKSDNQGFLGYKLGELFTTGNSLATVYDTGLGGSFKGDFSSSTGYAIGDIVIYDGNYYVFTSTHSAGAWVGTDADKLGKKSEFNASTDFDEITTTVPTIQLKADSTAKKAMADKDTLQDYNLTFLTTLAGEGIPAKKAMNAVTNDDYEAGKATLTIYTAGSDLTKEVTVIVTGLYTKDGKLHYMQESGEDIVKGSKTIGKKTYYFDEQGGQVVDGIAYNEAGKMVIIKDGEPQQGFINNGDKKGHNFYTDENGIVQTGKIVTDDKTVYYGDPENGWLETDVFKTVDGKLNYFGEDGKMWVGDGVAFKTITSLKESVNKGVYDYQIAADGTITTNKLVPFGTEGKSVFVNSYGQKVTVAMAENGKYTDPVTGQRFKIDENGFAEADKEYFFTGYTNVEWKWNSGAPTVTLTMNYVAKDGDNSPTEVLTLPATTTDPDTVNMKTYTATTVAKFIREGATEKETVTLTKRYDKDGKSAEYTFKSVKFYWPKQKAVGAIPVVTADVTYTVKEEGQPDKTETLSANAVVQVADLASDKYEQYKATVTALDNTVKSEEKKYDKKTGKLVEGGSEDSPSEPEQPENMESKNLFYTQVEKEIISLNLPEGADVSKGTGKWTAFYSVDEYGTVTVKATGKSDLQKAAKDANRVITIPVFGTDDSGASIEVGQFTYSLPVYYQKPTLKLTSTSGKVNTNKSEQTLTTYVTMKKSSGAFEKLDVSEATLKHTGGLTPEAGDELGEVNFKAKAKASGKLSVQLADWIEPVEVKYNVTESKKDVPTADKKAIIFNSGAYSVTGAEPESQTVILKVNGEEPSDENKLTLAAMPKGFDASGLKIADGCLNESSELTSSEFTVEYSGTAPATNKTKTYSFKFKTADNVPVTVKVTMSSLSLTNKALPLKVQTKMNLSTGQKMVLIPNFKGVTGNLVVNDLSEADAKNFALEYNEELGQIYLAPAEGATLSTKTQYTPVINTVVGGVPCTTQLKFKPSQSAIKVKIDKVTVPKSKMVDGSMAAEANVLCTYTLGGKTFAIAPNNQEDEKGAVTTKAVTFMLNNKTEAPMVEGTDGWYKIDKSNVLVKYEDSTGTILIRPTGKVANGKVGSVKVRLNFNGKIVNQTLSIKVDKKK